MPGSSHDLRAAAMRSRLFLSSAFLPKWGIQHRRSYEVVDPLTLNPKPCSLFSHPSTLQKMRNLVASPPYSVSHKVISIF